MRIIGGNYRGKKIYLPLDKKTRPLRDIVKESIFNLIEHSNKFNIVIKNSKILDLFAGSGSFGLECISRGAKKVIFLENYTKILSILKNIETFLDLKEKGNYKLPVTGVSMCVMKGNQHEVKLFEDFWINKVDMVTFQSFTPPTYDKDYSDFYPDELSLKERVSEKETFKCPQPFQRVVLRNDNITACCNTYSNNLKIGKLEDGIYNAWNSKFANELREMHRCGKYYENPTCKKCVEGTSSSN